MKKPVCVILALLFLLGAASCGAGGNETPSAGEQRETAVPAASAPLSEEATSPAEETAVSTEEQTAPRELTAAVANRYLGIADALSQRYGAGEISENGKWLKGLAFVKLIDLDGDGVEELICAYENPDRSDLFPYVNEYAVYGPDSDEPLFDPQPVSNFGNGDAPGMAFLTKQEKIYLKNEEGGYIISYSHLENGSLIKDITFEEAEDLENGTVKVWLNGEEVSPDAALAAMEQFEAGGQKNKEEFFDYDGAGTLEQVLRETDLTLSRLEGLGMTGI